MKLRKTENIGHILNVAGTFLFNFSQWVMSWYIARYVGYSEAGIFSIALSVSNVIAGIMRGGLRSKQLADTTRLRSVTTYFFARLITITLSLFLCFAYILNAGYSGAEYFAILICTAWNIVNNLSDPLFAELQLRGKLDKNGNALIIKSVASIVAFIVGIKLGGRLGYGLFGVLLAYSAVVLIYDIPSYFASVRSIPIQSKNESFGATRLVLGSIPLIIAQSLPNVTSAIPKDTALRGIGSAALGVYSCISTPTTVMSVLFSAVIMSVTPAIARAYEAGNLKELRKIVMLCTAGIAGTGIVAEVAALLIGKPIMAFVYGNDILEEYNLLYVTIATTVVYICGTFSCTVLIAIGQDKMILVGATASALVSLCVSGFFIREFGIYGISYTLAAADGAQTIVNLLLYFLQKYLKIKKGTR